MTKTMEQVKEVSNDTIDQTDSKANLKSNFRPAKSRRKKKQSVSAEISKLQAKVSKVENEREEVKDMLLRKAAEFDNYKRRTDNEFALHIANANAQLITKLLPVLDDLERSLNAANESKDFESLREGVSLIFKNLVKVLDDSGVEPIAAIGEEFDPEKHDALMQIENKEYPSGIVVDEHLKGYKMNDRVLRHAQVLVSK